MSDFVARFAHTSRELGHRGREIQARYTDGTDRSVQITCFIKNDEATPELRENFQRLYILEDTYYAIRAKGVAGRYSCFDDSYRRLAMARLEETGSPPPNNATEVYINYPVESSSEQTFDALLLN